MLSELHISSFKCFENLDLRLRPLTLLSGVNGGAPSCSKGRTSPWVAQPTSSTRRPLAVGLRWAPRRTQSVSYGRSRPTIAGRYPWNLRR